MVLSVGTDGEAPDATTISQNRRRRFRSRSSTKYFGNVSQKDLLVEQYYARYLEHTRTILPDHRRSEHQEACRLVTVCSLM